MTNIMYELPSRCDVDKCIVTRETVETEKDPQLVIADSVRLTGETSEAEPA